MIMVHNNYLITGGRGNWTTNGCKLESDKDGVVTCSCSHLTNFAVLLVSFEAFLVELLITLNCHAL